MHEVLNNLEIGSVLHVTNNGTHYLYLRRANDNGVIYSINLEEKTLPLNTIMTALHDFNNGSEINAQWYDHYNHQEFVSRPCNLSVLLNLLERVNNLD